MLPLFLGAETSRDLGLLRKFITHDLIVDGEAQTGMKDRILYLATIHPGLMHSILSATDKRLASTKFATYANPHYDKAMDSQFMEVDPGNEATYAQILCLMLQARADNNTVDEQKLIEAQGKSFGRGPFEYSEIHNFITGFFKIGANIAERKVVDTVCRVDWMPFSCAPKVTDAAELLENLPRINGLRKLVSDCKKSSYPLVDKRILEQAVDIEISIQNWAPPAPTYPGWGPVWLLLKQTMWIHLFHSLNPPTERPVASSVSDRMNRAVDGSLKIINEIKPSKSNQHILLVASLFIGTACSQPIHRELVEEKVESIQKDSTYGQTVLAILKDVWSSSEPWDLPHFVIGKNLDFLLEDE